MGNNRLLCFTSEGFCLLLLVTWVSGQRISAEEEIDSIIDDLEANIKTGNGVDSYGELDEPEESEENDLHSDYSTFSRDRRARWMRCSFHNLCYCRNRVSRNEFCCDCNQGQCFPADATVHTESDGEIRMDQLKVGHRVLTATEGGVPTFTSVLTFMDRRPRVQGEYLLVETKGGARIELSANHLVFSSADNGSMTLQSRYARDIRIGDYFITLGPALSDPIHLSPVVNISRVVQTGAYVPLTEHGTIAVGGVLASCYASFDHTMAHAVMSPLRWFPDVLGLRHDSSPGVALYVRLAKSIGRATLPRSLQDGSMYWSEVEVVRLP